MSDADRAESQASSRVAELEDKIQKAAALIGELRETNYSLSGEIAELRRELAETPGDGGGSSASSDGVSASASNDDGGSSAELEALRSERKAIREKVALLLERIEKLES